jgi:hypothetical protein
VQGVFIMHWGKGAAAILAVGWVPCARKGLGGSLVLYLLCQWACLAVLCVSAVTAVTWDAFEFLRSFIIARLTTLASV